MRASKRPSCGSGAGAPSTPLGAEESVGGVRSVQRQLEALEEETAAEIIKVHREAEARRLPLREARRKAIATVPGFWLTAMSGHPMLAPLISLRDQQILAHLVDLDVREGEGVSDYTIALSFSANEYIANQALEVSLEVSEEGDMTFTSTALEWKPHQAPEEVKAALDRREAARAAAVQDGDELARTDAAGRAQKRSHEEATFEASDPVFLLTILPGAVEAAPVPAGASGAEAAAEAAADGEAIEQVLLSLKEEIFDNPLAFYEARLAQLAEGLGAPNGERH